MHDFPRNIREALEAIAEQMGISLAPILVKEIGKVLAEVFSVERCRILLLTAMKLVAERRHETLTAKGINAVAVGRPIRDARIERSLELPPLVAQRMMTAYRSQRLQFRSEHLQALHELVAADVKQALTPERLSEMDKRCWQRSVDSALASLSRPEGKTHTPVPAPSAAEQPI